MSFFVIGQRINLTSDRALAVELEQGKTEILLSEASAQITAGAHALDVNAAPGEGESRRVRKIVSLLTEFNVPVAVDSSNPAVLLESFDLPGRLIVNSVRADSFMDILLARARESEAVVIAMTFDGAVPRTAEDRIRNAERLLLAARKNGIREERIWIDPVLMPVKFFKDSISQTLEAVLRISREWQVKTCVGLSNVSYGLPNRSEANARFLRLAMDCGLGAAILDPFDAEVMKVARSSGETTEDTIDRFCGDYACV